MIDGFKIDVAAEELVAHLERRVAYHRARTGECESRLRRLQALEPAASDDDDDYDFCASSRVHGVERRMARHRNREVFLMFARTHLVATEVYRLSEGDLRLLEWLPADEPDAAMARF